VARRTGEGYSGGEGGEVNQRAQCVLFPDPTWNGLRRYGRVLTAAENGKGVMDVDTVKGCTMGMAAYPAAVAVHLAAAIRGARR